ncbi:DUF1064 domain-containing protein [Pararhizobium mangrovi]|uniref:DUF1064 domain-containing protein n=1 Tax=Pararhizobium mangrovi TaxID=2590452 RepID=A0A506TVA9_9HYPH|nr:DUF1064 domain-containing protein [Pararhizobium mangrovi]TPW26012.1 DUF1064 domain-containing protein [Pararhizobium mangrovi]
MTERISAAEARAQAGKRRSKYGNRRCELDGIRFDSKAERDYYARLKQREKAGEVGGVELQRPFAMIGPDGRLITTYKADFAFWDHTADRFRVIDVKGVETAVFKIKRKMMRSFHGIEVEVVKA